jgi:hypothetical protein
LSKYGIGEPSANLSLDLFKRFRERLEKTEKEMEEAFRLHCGGDDTTPSLNMDLFKFKLSMDSLAVRIEDMKQ